MTGFSKSTYALRFVATANRVPASPEKGAGKGIMIMYESRLYNENGLKTGFLDQTSRTTPVLAKLWRDLYLKSAIGVALDVQTRFEQGEKGVMLGKGASPLNHHIPFDDS